MAERATEAQPSAHSDTAGGRAIASKITEDDVRNWQRELEDIETNLKRDSKEDDLFHRALLLYSLDRYGEARDTLNRLKKLNPTYPDVEELSADIDAALGGAAGPVKEKRKIHHHHHRKYRLWNK